MALDEHLSEQHSDYNSFWEGAWMSAPNSTAIHLTNMAKNQRMLAASGLERTA